MSFWILNLNLKFNYWSIYSILNHHIFIFSSKVWNFVVISVCQCVCRRLRRGKLVMFKPIYLFSSSTNLFLMIAKLQQKLGFFLLKKVISNTNNVVLLKKMHKVVLAKAHQKADGTMHTNVDERILESHVCLFPKKSILRKIGESNWLNLFDFCFVCWGRHRNPKDHGRELKI